MDWTPLYINTLIPQIPTVINSNFNAFKNYLDVFYDENGQVIVKPVNTTGRVKAATGEFVTVIADNMTVRNQYTNIYENVTTADLDFVNVYNGDDVSTRIATSETSTNIIWPLEPSAYSWVDVQTSYIKITNDVSYGFQNDALGQEFRVIFDRDVSTTSPYTILIDVSEGGEQNLSVTYADSETTWLKLITTAYDASYGPKWTVKEYAGNYTIS